MDGNLSLILAFLVSISVVLALVIKFKLHPFLSLFIGCLLKMCIRDSWWRAWLSCAPS